ncbi:alpha/beta fold hydrolase [Streptomyces indicus]|uniref:Pimeloyl-ACP methyl ester carboxylesterase n=1 Tax=Streptomyces indicus TaxID=417292 RepID=A0A1G8ZT47_9ACTN|nr:alpha/beta hydrolase [Streptomyces indicus]SDK18177.1 Pimeloyl-ACP methyl ester carboxylesterase [Streptomyces indicus]
MTAFSAPDGTRLAYRTTGSGEPLICVPGGAMRASAYLGDLGGLAAHRQLVLPDLRGTGASEIPADPATYRCDRQVADIEALRVHLGLDRIDLLGHSAGSNLALLYAAAHPERVRRLVLVTPTLWAVGIEVTPEHRREAALLRSGEPWFEAAWPVFDARLRGEETEGCFEAFFYGRWDAQAQAHAASGAAQVNEEAAVAYGSEGAYDPPATRAALARLDAEVLVLCGELDGGPRPQVARALAEVLPQAQFDVQAGGGHFPWLDDAGAFRRTLAAFLDPSVRSVRTPRGRLAYTVTGAEDAPPVVLVHGRGADRRDWAHIAAGLAADHRVFAPDLTGHGLSDWPGSYSFAGFREDLRTFIEALGLRGATVIGHSMGGAAAWLLAQDAPGLIGRLVLEEAPAMVPLDPRRGPAEHPGGDLDFDWPVVPATDRDLNDPDPAWRAGHERITPPTLVIAGGAKSHVPQDQIAAMAARMPDARLVTIEAGHLVHEERPDAFLRALAEFGV